MVVRLLIYNKNNKGPIQLPWITPHCVNMSCCNLNLSCKPGLAVSSKTLSDCNVLQVQHGTQLGLRQKQQPGSIFRKYCCSTEWNKKLTKLASVVFSINCTRLSAWRSHTAVLKSLQIQESLYAEDGMWTGETHWLRFFYSRVD